MHSVNFLYALPVVEARVSKDNNLCLLSDSIGSMIDLYHRHHPDRSPLRTKVSFQTNFLTQDQSGEEEETLGARFRAPGFCTTKVT